MTEADRGNADWLGVGFTLGDDLQTRGCECEGIRRYLF
jgi:hypothetical protein